LTTRTFKSLLRHDHVTISNDNKLLLGRPTLVGKALSFTY